MQNLVSQCPPIPYLMCYVSYVSYGNLQHQHKHLLPQKPCGDGWLQSASRSNMTSLQYNTSVYDIMHQWAVINVCERYACVLCKIYSILIIRITIWIVFSHTDYISQHRMGLRWNLKVQQLETGFWRSTYFTAQTIKQLKWVCRDFSESLQKLLQTEIPNILQNLQW